VETDLVNTSGGTVNVDAPRTARFSDWLGQQCAPLFDAFWDHPAVAGLRDGSLPAECVRHYVSQDHQYLTAFMRCYGLGIAASPDRDWVSWFHDQVEFLLIEETQPHHALCRAIGVSYDHLQGRDLAPTARGYVDHMMAAGHDSLGVLLAALLPCPWTYTWAACRFIDHTPPAAEHPFAEWWWFYGSTKSQQQLTDFRARLDALATSAGEDERRRMTQAFETSCQYEVRFWQMAWTQEDWLAPHPAS
jgi:thiaminase/transcriptional activator TenA